MESRLADGQLLLEFELIPRRKAGADFSMAAHPDNLTRNQYVERMMGRGMHYIIFDD